MLGRTVSDPEQVEAAGVTESSGMGLLDMDTEFRGEKVQALSLIHILVSLQTARDRRAGGYHLMSGQNPIYIFTMQGGGETA